MKLFKRGREPKPVVPTGLIAFDKVSGGGLFPGRTVELRGQMQSGKTTLAITLAGYMREKGYRIVYFDTMHMLDGTEFEKKGLSFDDPETFLLYGGANPIEIRDACLQLLEEEPHTFIILDSLEPLLTWYFSFAGKNPGMELLEAQHQLRPILADIVLATHRAGGMLMLLNDHRITQFGYYVNRRFESAALQPMFPLYLLSGIIELQVNSSEIQDGLCRGRNVKLINRLGRGVIPVRKAKAYLSTKDGFTNKPFRAPHRDMALDLQDPVCFSDNQSLQGLLQNLSETESQNLLESDILEA